MPSPRGLRNVAWSLLLVVLVGCAGSDSRLSFCEAVDAYSKVALAPGGTKSDPATAIQALDQLIKAAPTEEGRTVFRKMQAGIVYQRDKAAGNEVGGPPEPATFEEITTALGGRCPPP